MSEYQDYEFATADHPLVAVQQLSEFPGSSPRTHITASSFVNESHWDHFGVAMMSRQSLGSLSESLSPRVRNSARASLHLVQCR